MFFVSGTQSPICDHWARFWAGSHEGQEAEVGGVGRISKTPSCRLTAEEAKSPLLPRPENKVSVCQSASLLPPSSALLNVTPPCPRHGMEK